MNKAAMNMNFQRANKDIVEAVEALNIARGLVQAAQLANNPAALEDAHDRLKTAERQLYKAASLAGSIACAIDLSLS